MSKDPILLAVDVGNTNIVIGIFQHAKLAGHWRFTTDRNRTSDELRLTLRGLFEEIGIERDQIEGAVVASVVPSLSQPLRSALSAFAGDRVRCLNADTSPIELRVDEPWSVGADRIANCVAGYRIHGGPILAIDFGTAVTFDLVSEDGAFLGGAIAPEMRLAARALFDRAAQLHSVPLEIPSSVIGKTTASNIQAGIVLGFLDMVDGLIARFRQAVGDTLRVVATGGKGKLFHEQIEAIDLYEPFLTLDGLRICWETWTQDSRD